MAAKGAGLRFIAVMENDVRTKNDFKDLNVDLFIDKFCDIVPYILDN